MEKLDKEKKKALISAYKERKQIGGVFVIKNTVTGQMLLMSTLDLQGAKNSFHFAQKVGGCFHMKLQEVWKEFGGEAFIMEVLEELKKQETQTNKEFRQDMDLLEEMWLEKLDSATLY